MTNKTKKIPMRRCIGCMESKPKEELVRIAFYEGSLTVDTTGRAKGRGVYLCRNSEKCLEDAVRKKAFQRSFRQEVPKEEIQRVIEELKTDEK